MPTSEQMLSLLVTLTNETAGGFATIQADLKKSQVDSLALAGSIDKLGLSIDKLSGGMVRNVGASDAMVSGQRKAATSLDQTTAATLRQERALLRFGGELAGVRQGFAAAGVGLGGWTAILGGAAVFAAARFETEMQKLQGNTGANAIAMKQYTATVLDLQSKGPAALDDIAVGLRHVSDLGYRGADATKVLDEAWKGAIATGAKTADVANALATVLGNQHETASQASKDIDILVTAAQQGNETIQDFATHFSRIGVIMGSLHQPLTDGAAMLATISRATADPAVAQTYGQNMLMHIINPTKAAITEMDRLKRSTGIDLQRAFQEFAQGQISLKDVLTQSRAALQGNIGDTEKLFGGLRGGQGAVILMNNHWKDYNQILNTVGHANKNVQTSFEQMQRTTGAQLATMKNQIIGLGQSIGKDLLPDVKDLAGGLSNAATGLKHFNDATGGGVSDLIKAGIEIYAITKTVNALRLGYIALRDAEIAAWIASNPITLAAAGVVIAGMAIKKVNDAVDANGTGMDALAQKYYHGKQSLADFIKVEEQHGHGLSEALILQAEAYKRETMQADAVKKHANNLRDLNNLLSERQKLEAPGKLADLISSKPATPTTPKLDLAADIKYWQDQQTKAVNAIYSDVNGPFHKATQAHINELNKDKEKIAELTALQTQLTSTTANLAAANRAAAAPILASAKAAENFGKAMASSIPTIKSWDAAGLTAARDLRSFATQQTRGQEVPITTSIRSATIPYLTGSSGSPASQLYANSRPYGGTPQIDPTILPRGTSATAEAFSPSDRAAMSHLSDAIHQLPPEFQGAFSSTVTHLQEEEKKNYNEYIDKLNKESQRDAEAKTKIEAAHDATVAKANEKAQTALTKANQDYLSKLDNQEAKHNQDLESHLASFNVAFQSALATFEANMLADQQKAESERQIHNDNLTKDYGTLQERLAGEHGKNAAAARQHDWDLYNQQVRTEDQNYTRQVSAMENHVKGQANAFVGHVKNLKDTLDGANKNSNDTLARQQRGDKTSYDRTVGAVKGSLWDAIFGPKGANATERAALTTEYDRHSSRDDSLLSGYRKSDKTSQDAAKIVTPAGQVSTIQSGLQKAFDAAQAQVTLDIVKHGHATQADIAALAIATKGLNDFTGVTNKTKNALYDLSTVAGFLGAHFGNVGQAAPGVPSIATTVGGGGFAATVGGIIAGGIKLRDTFEQQVAAGLDSIKTSKEQERVNLEVAKRSGDVATQFSIISKEYYEGRQTLDDFLRITKENTLQLDDHRIKEIAYDQATGDTAGALKLITDQYHEQKTSLSTLTQAYNDNADAVARTTQADRDFFAATGQFGQLLSSISTEIGQGVTDSQAKVTLDVYTGNTAAIKADTDSAIAHREAQDALTKATWDAQYSTANAATQSQMRNSLASPMVSQQSTVQGLASGVFNAQLGVIAAQGALQVSELQAEVTATNDLAGIITAQAGVAKAQGDKQLAALNDQIPVLNDQHSIAQDIKDGNTQQLAIDKQQLLIDQTTAAMDQAVANFQIQIAQDQLQMAQDKMMVDQANAQAAFTVAQDQLTLAQDNVTLAEATQKIGLDQLTVQTDIATSLGSVVDYLNLIDGDLQNLQSAQDQVQTDQSNLAYDTSNQGLVGMYGQQVLAGDTVTQAGDSAAMQQAQQAYELQIAQYKVQQASLQIQQKDSATNGQSVAALQAMLKVFQQMMVNVHSPAGKAVMAAGIGGNTLNTLQNSFSTTQVPMGFN